MRLYVCSLISPSIIDRFENYIAILYRIKIVMYQRPSLNIIKPYYYYMAPLL